MIVGEKETRWICLLDAVAVHVLLILASLFFLPSLLATPWKNSGHILFLIGKGQDSQAISIYKQLAESSGAHQYEVLRSMGVALLDQGHRQKDPEIQIMSLFGASISLDDDLYYILEDGLKNPHPQIQLASLSALAKMQSDRADRALLRALSAEHPLIRFIALGLLCEKKVPQASMQAESLMIKFPKELHHLFPQLFAMIGDERSNKVLRRLLNDSSEDVRVSTIMSIAEQQRDDFLPQIRQLSSQFNFSQQEVCAKALGVFHDEKSKGKLEKLANSQYPSVALAAKEALVRMGNDVMVEDIVSQARGGNIFAISVLGSIEGVEETLVELINNKDIQIRMNAAIALLNQEDPRCLKGVLEILIHDKRHLGFSKVSSPGQAFTAWKATASASKIFETDPSFYAEHLEFREAILEKASKLPQKYFLEIAEAVFSQFQYELVPKLIAILSEMHSQEVVKILNAYRIHLGAPLIRQYCNLALYKMNEEGPYGSELKEWVRNQKKAGLIQFRPMLPWDKLGNSFSRELTPEEKSNLLVQSYEIFTQRQDDEAISILLDAIQTGDSKNKYVLAGILVRAVQ